MPEISVKFVGQGFAASHGQVLWQAVEKEGECSAYL
jgi:hypothetical protein